MANHEIIRGLFYIFSIPTAIVLAFILGNWLFKQGIMSNNPKRIKKFVREWREWEEG